MRWGKRRQVVGAADTNGAQYATLKGSGTGADAALRGESIRRSSGKTAGGK
jgi:hypothetical protein